MLLGFFSHLNVWLMLFLVLLFCSYIVKSKKVKQNRLFEDPIYLLCKGLQVFSLSQICLTAPYYNLLDPVYNQKKKKTHTKSEPPHLTPCKVPQQWFHTTRNELKVSRKLWTTNSKTLVCIDYSRKRLQAWTSSRTAALIWERQNK